MNSNARKLLADARRALKDEPDAIWPAAVVEIAEMLGDREKELVALQKQLGVTVCPCCVRISQALMAVRSKHL